MWLAIPSTHQKSLHALAQALLRNAGGLLFGFACGVFWQHRQRQRYRPAGSSTNDSQQAHIVAIFCNPRLPSKYGLAPLSFGQDLKFMMRTLPQGMFYVEPAASLYTMRRALVHHRPRCLILSGHTSPNGHFCFETPDGRYDQQATLDLLVHLLRTLHSALPDGGPPPEAVAAVEAHLAAQEAAALEMQHCSRAWMERASAERAVDQEVAAVSRSSSSSSRSSAAAGGGVRTGLLQIGPLQLGPLRALESPLAAALGGGPPRRLAPELALGQLQCVFLNACSSIGIGTAIVRALPSVACVCWSTLTEDSAARSFLVGFLQKIADDDAGRRTLLRPWARGKRHESDADGLERVRSAFDAGCASFARDGFRFGDPAGFLHPPGHEHWRRPQWSTCPSCVPPVQGRAVLLTADEQGGVHATYGGPSVTTRHAEQAAAMPMAMARQPDE